MGGCSLFHREDVSCLYGPPKLYGPPTPESPYGPEDLYGPPTSDLDIDPETETDTIEEPLEEDIPSSSEE